MSSLRRASRTPSALPLAIVIAVATSAGAQPLAIDSPRRLSDSSPGGAILADVAADPHGGFVIGWRWSTSRVANPSYGVSARRLDADGEASGPGVTLERSPPRDSRQPAVAVGSDGAAIAAWSEGTAIVVQRLESPDSRTFLRGYEAGYPSEPDLAATGQQRFLAAWSMSSNPELVARWIDGDGVPVGAPFRVADSSMLGGTPVVAGRNDGHAAVAWLTASGLRGAPHVRVYGPDGTPTTPERALPLTPEATLQATVLALAGAPDGFVAAYAERERGGEPSRIVIQPFSLAGVPGTRIDVAEIDGSADALGVAVNAHGMGIVVWTDDEHSDDGRVRAAMVDVRVGTVSDVIALRYPDSRGSGPSIAAGTDGRFLMAWTGGGGDSSPPGVYGTLLTSCGNGHLEAGEACDDGDRVDGDCCSSTCDVDHVAGRCWRVVASDVRTFAMTARVRGLGRASCTARCRTTSAATLVLRDDGTYRWRPGRTDCTRRNGFVLPDETGEWRAKGSRLQLRPRNARALRTLLEACTGEHPGIPHASIRYGGDGLLRGTRVVESRWPRSVLPRALTRSRLVGAPMDADGTPAAPPSRAPGAAECTDDPVEDLRWRCVR